MNMKVPQKYDRDLTDSGESLTQSKAACNIVETATEQINNLMEPKVKRAQ